jgi:hypothetical protein
MTTDDAKMKPECPSYDGKRCLYLGHRPCGICESAAKSQGRRLAEVEAELNEADAAAGGHLMKLREVASWDKRKHQVGVELRDRTEAAEARAEQAERKLAATMEVVGQYEEAQQQMERQAYRGGWAEATEAAARVVEQGRHGGDALAKAIRANAHRKTPEPAEPDLPEGARLPDDEDSRDMLLVLWAKAENYETGEGAAGWLIEGLVDRGLSVGTNAAGRVIWTNSGRAVLSRAKDGAR